MSTTRPILEWYNDLPEPYRSQAIANYDPEFSPEVNGVADSLHAALNLGWHWLTCPEGDTYWHDIYESTMNREADKPAPRLWTDDEAVALLREVVKAGNGMYGILLTSAQKVGHPDLGEVEACQAWDIAKSEIAAKHNLTLEP